MVWSPCCPGDFHEFSPELLNTSILLCNRHHYRSSKLSSCKIKTVYHLVSNFPLHPPPSPLENTILCEPEITRVQNTGTRCFWNKAGVATRPDNGQVKTGIRSSGDWGHFLLERPWTSNPISLSLTFCRGCHFCKMRLLNGSNGRMNVKGTKTAYAFPRWVSSFYRSQRASLNKPHIHPCCDPSWHLPGLEETRTGHSEV